MPSTNPSPSLPPAGPGRNCRIALLDDDPLMRELARRWLEEAGHAVLSGESEAGGRVDLVMLDAPDPRAARERIQALRQHLQAPVLLVSARLRRSSDPSPALALQLGAAAVLAKPYSREQLLAAVAAALAGGG